MEAMQIEKDLEVYERPSWGDTAVIVVPKAERLEVVSSTIRPGSGIVACRHVSDRMLAYYEGNLLGSDCMKSLAARAFHAYGRMAQRYPTVAMASLDSKWFTMVGTISSRHFDLDRHHPDLLAWVAEDESVLEQTPDAWWSSREW